MFRPRVIPVLLLKNQGLVKSIKYKNYNYIGDPINAVKIFNDLEADELVFLDIDASKENRLIPLEFVKKVGNEANMPFAVGGGIKSIRDIKEIINAGAEKVILNTHAVLNRNLIYDAANEFGNSTIAISIDVKKNFLGKEQVYIYGGKVNSKISPIEFAKIAESEGAGEIIINSIANDGLMNGYNIPLIKNLSENLTIPVIASCGAGSYKHLKEAVIFGNASAVAAGSLFVYHGPRKAVLINYPTQKELIEIFIK